MRETTAAQCPIHPLETNVDYKAAMAEMNQDRQDAEKAEQDRQRAEGLR